MEQTLFDTLKHISKMCDIDNIDGNRLLFLIKKEAESAIELMRGKEE